MRKNWLSNYDKNKTLDYNLKEVQLNNLLMMNLFIFPHQIMSIITNY